MLVARVIGDCPVCGGERTFGNVLVLASYVLRGCGSCGHKDKYLIPELRPKKVLYLDQNFYSAAFRHERDASEGQPEIVRLMRRIKDLAAAQVLSVPRSSVHEDETRQWKYRAELLEFLKVATRGHKFERAYRLEERQLLKAFQAWLAGEGPGYVIAQSEALPQEIHQWDGYLFVDVEFDRGDGTAETARKIGSVKNLVGLFDEWRTAKSSFDEDFRGELAAQAQLYFRNHKQWLNDYFSGDATTLLAASAIDRMRNCLPRGTEVEEGYRKCQDFFASEHFARVPVHSITCRTHAQLKQDVMTGSHPVAANALKSLRGYYTDLEHIAHYAPYCDAIAIDKAMAEMMKKPGVSLERNYGVKVFSLNSVAAFHGWLDDLEASITSEHREALAAVYG